MDVFVAGEPALHRPKRDDDRVVAVLAEVALSLRLKHADDRARDRAQAQAAADRFGVSEQLGARRLSDDADGGARSQLAVREPAPVGQRPVAGLEVLVGGPRDSGGSVLGAADDAEA